MKTITEMAREAGAAVGCPAPGAPEIIFPQCLDVQHFAELVRADEREACAIDGGLACRYFEDSERVKNAIRARGNT